MNPITRRRIARVALGLISLTTMSGAFSQTCTTRWSDELRHTTPTGQTSVAVSAFTLRCHGEITGSLTAPTASTRNIRLQIEKKSDQLWTVVKRGNHIAYHAEPGIYRYSVHHMGEGGHFFDWHLRYSKPLP